MPHFLKDTTPTHLVRYSNLGSNWNEIIETLILRPDKVLFHIGLNLLSWKTLLRLLFPFLGLPLLSGWVILLPFWGWLPHLLSSYQPQRELVAQYAAGVLPLLAIAACLGLRAIFQKKQGVFGRFRIWFERITPWPLALVITMNWAFGVPRYYRPISQERRDAIDYIAQRLPVNAGLSAQSDLGPHFMARKTLRQFPDTTDCYYVLLDMQGNIWPIATKEEYIQKVEEIQKQFNMIEERSGIALFKKSKI